MPSAMSLPPMKADELHDALLNHKAQNVPTYGPRMFRPSYFAGQDVVDVAENAFRLFMKENWLYGRTSYPAVGVFEDEIMASLMDLFHAPAGAGGTLTSGGTESDIMAVKSARDRSRASGRVPGGGNIVIPHTAHPALEKGCELLGLEPRREPGRGRHLPDLQWMADACDDGTVMLVGSAPPYPFGQCDPIRDLAEIARERDIWLHVDACLGGSILPFRAAAGLDPVDFDFCVQGVSSISIDLHKCGYASKGISALVYADRDDEVRARTEFSDWPSGLYATPGVAGTRSAGALASAWAVMRYLGREGYEARAREVFGNRDRMITALRDIGAKIVGVPHAYHFCFLFDDVDMTVLVEELLREGWVIASSKGPDAVQMMITAAHGQSAGPFASDVARLLGEIKSGQRSGTGLGAVYSRVETDNKVLALRDRVT